MKGGDLVSALDISIVMAHHVSHEDRERHLCANEMLANRIARERDTYIMSHCGVCRGRRAVQGYTDGTKADTRVGSQMARLSRRALRETNGERGSPTKPTANPPTQIVDFRGFDSSRILI